MNGIPVKRILRRSLLVGLMVVACSSVAVPAENDPQALLGRLKAAYLFNIAKFVDWPADAESVNLCLDPTKPVGQVALSLQGKEVAQNKKLVVVPLEESHDRCHLAYFEWPAADLSPSLTHDVLTISDAPDALADGYVIQLFLQRDKLRFGVNPEALKLSPYRISAKLLRLARDPQ